MILVEYVRSLQLLLVQKHSLFMFCVYFVLSENKLSASTAEMFEVVGRFLKCFGLLSQVG